MTKASPTGRTHQSEPELQTLICNRRERETSCLVITDLSGVEERIIASTNIPVALLQGRSFTRDAEARTKVEAYRRSYPEIVTAYLKADTKAVQKALKRKKRLLHDLQRGRDMRWCNWYIDRGLMSNPPTARELRRWSNRRKH